MIPARNLKIVLADDHALARCGLRVLLEGMKAVSEVFEARNGREAVVACVNRRPHLALLEAGLPGLNGVDATARIARQAAQTRVVVFGRQTGEEVAARALVAGAAGFLAKDATSGELEAALHSVMRGVSYLSPSLSKPSVHRMVADARKSPGRAGPLTLRQREILQLVAEGNTSKEIAAALSVSIKTVETHRAHIMHRLGIRDLAGLVRYSVRHGIVPV